jgi:hypothetical protein
MHSAAVQGWWKMQKAALRANTLHTSRKRLPPHSRRARFYVLIELKQMSVCARFVLKASTKTAPEAAAAPPPPTLPITNE